MKKKELDTNENIITNTSVFENKTNKNVDIPKQLIGLFVFICIFVLWIPYLLIKIERFSILEGYIPNIDMIATLIGFQWESFKNISSYFKYLYNPNSLTIYGYFSQVFINYIALLGLTFYISYYTYKNRSIIKGWSRAIIMLPITYLLPNNIIAFYMSKFNTYLKKQTKINNIYIQDAMVCILGILCILLFIFTEKILIDMFGDKIASVIQKLYI